MSALFGIHLGNSSASVAFCKDDDRVDVIANDAGERVTPALVQWTPSNCTVGRAAQLEHFRNTSCTVTRNKQLLNEAISNEELEDLKLSVPYKINKTDGGLKYELLCEGKQHHVSPKDIATFIFKKIQGIAEAAVGVKTDLNVVMCVPLYYTPRSVEGLRDIATKAGFNVIQVIDEACAAALGAGLPMNVDEEQCNCLVYRVGGVSIDATVLSIRNGMFVVLGTVHRHSLGGRTLTNKLADFLASEFKRMYKNTEIKERGSYKLLNAAETVKQILSIQNVAQCSAESIGDGLDLNVNVSRARFENTVSQTLQDMVKPITEVLAAAKLTVNDIQKVVTCGGVLKTPKLQDLVRQLLPKSEFVVGPNTSPDELICLGAAQQALFASKYTSVPDSLYIEAPIINTDITITARASENTEVTTFKVAANSLVPFKKKFELQAVEPNLSVSLEVNAVPIVTLSLDELEPAAKVHVDLDINKERKGTFTVVNETSGKKTNAKVDLNESQSS